MAASLMLSGFESEQVFGGGDDSGGSEYSGHGGFCKSAGAVGGLEEQVSRDSRTRNSLLCT